MDTQCRPQPPLAAGPLARESGATAMMDISDGLVRDGNRMAAASRAVLNLDAAVLKELAVPLLPAAGAARRGPDGLGPGRRGGPRTAGHIPRRAFSCLTVSLR